ncbi:MAG: type IV pilus secretin PilQ [Holophaga sp.]|nr:type IV pilus secretin PilQ [Holophaga sp.]
MNARLSSLLVAGGVVLAAIPSTLLIANTTEKDAPSRSSVLKGVVLQDQNENALDIDIPGFVGKPRLQVMSNPDRVVIDLPGVVRGDLVTKGDIAAYCKGIIRKSRIAQFATEPTPVTRIVFEVSKGAQVSVSSHEGGISAVFQEGAGAIQARLVPSTMITAAPMDTELVVAKSEIPLVSEPSETKSLLPLVPLPSVGMTYRALPGIAASTILPASPNFSQDKTAQPQPAPYKEAVRGGRTLGDSRTRYTGTLMSIDARGTDLQDFLSIIAGVAKLNLIADQDVQGIFNFRFVDTPWDQVLDHIVKHAGLGMEINNGVIRVAKIEKLQKEEEDRKRLDDAKSLAGDTQNISRPLSFAKVSEVKPILDKIITKRGSIITDERTNTLIITDLPRNIVLIDDLIAQLDVQIQQVLIEARVVEASKGFEQAWGVKWPTTNSGDAKLQTGGTDAAWGTYGTAPSWNSSGGFNRPPSGQAVGTAWSLGKPGVTDIAGAAGEFWVSFLSNRMSVNVILQALEKEGKVKIVSTPKVVTQNNKKAKILSGEKIPYPSQQGGAAGGAITVAFVEANLQLDVTPQITNDGTIIMDIKVEKSEADFSRTVQGSPTILRKEIDTQVLVKDGGTAVLGGVYTTNTTSGTTGVPFISKIPILGWLFKTKSDKESTAELLIFITPRIIKS